MKWLEQIYYFYSLSPYSKKLSRSLRKQPKIYLWDWTEIEGPESRFENLVANHLLKACDFWTDGGKGIFELHYIRDKEKREVDFLVTHNRKPWMLIEAKLNNISPSDHLLRFASILNPQITLQVVHSPGIQEFFRLSDKAKGILISADRFLSLLP